VQREHYPKHLARIFQALVSKLTTGRPPCTYLPPVLTPCSARTLCCSAGCSLAFMRLSRVWIDLVPAVPSFVPTTKLD
jgi:hypothetical protein